MSSSIHAQAPKLPATQALSTDWNARLNQNPAADPQGGAPGEFSRWLERHVAQGQDGRPPAVGPQSSASVEARNAAARAQSEMQTQSRAQVQAQLQRRQAESTRSAASDGVKAPESAPRQEGKDAAKASEARASSSRSETAKPNKTAEKAEKADGGAASAEAEVSQATESMPANEGGEEGALDEKLALDE